MIYFSVEMHAHKGFLYEVFLIFHTANCNEVIPPVLGSRDGSGTETMHCKISEKFITNIVPFANNVPANVSAKKEFF